MSNQKTTMEYEKFFKQYVNLKRRINEIEGPDGYIVKLFKEMYKDTSGRITKNMYDKNLIIKQEAIEKQLIESKNENALRFFKPYYFQYFSKIARGNVPEFLKSKFKPSIYMPDNYADETQKNKSQKQFEELSPKQLKIEMIKIAKESVVTHARKANILNRFKNSEDVIFSELMKAKDDAMESFIFNAIRYNSIMPDTMKIAFGINDSEKGPVLEASVPGYTRLSLHFGNELRCAKILKNINTRLENVNAKKYFPTSMKNKNIIDMKEVYKTHGYELPKYRSNKYWYN